MINIFIGFDERESIAYHVCSHSILRKCSTPVAIMPLGLHLLDDYKEEHTDGSNNFIYSRFLIPHLMNYKGWAIFIDGDMIVRDDIKQLWDKRDSSKAVLCVKHDYKTKSTKKYLGANNENYPRKNWSSVVLWNCEHPSNRAITPAFVQSRTGAQLHRFTWLEDSEIGGLPIEWNWLPDEFGPNKEAKLLHWTLGTPCFNEYAKAPMAELWHQEKKLVMHTEQMRISATG